MLAQPPRWTGTARVLADPPTKAYGRRGRPWMADQVQVVLNNAEQEVHLITPYYVPCAAGLSALKRLMQRRVKVSLLTNALAALTMLSSMGPMPQVLSARHACRPKAVSLHKAL